VYFYGVDGQKLGTYTFTLGQYGQTNVPEMTNSTVLLATFFGRKRIGTFDRLGSAKYNQNNAAQSFYPYGEDRGTVEPNDSLKFATYTRDAATGLDYADQRYYANNFGRMMSPDPYKASGGPKDPKSWNRYTYVLGDPLNYYDPGGRFALYPEIEDPFGSGDGGGGGGGGGCEAVLIIAADPESDTPAGIDCLFETFGGGEGGTGIGAKGPSAGVAHSPGSSVGPAGYTGALALLKVASAKCLKDLDASGSAAAIAKLTGSTISYTWGTVPTLDASGNIVNGTVPAQSDPSANNGAGSILINLNFGWMNPTNLTVNLVAGGTGVTDFVLDVGTSIGDPALTTSQYYELVLLHELGHLLGVPQEPKNNPTYNTNIFNDCINGH
jgi:RHS repeat-associated protein